MTQVFGLRNQKGGVEIDQAQEGRKNWLKGERFQKFHFKNVELSCLLDMDRETLVI